jgi:hypothetical protein
MNKLENLINQVRNISVKPNLSNELLIFRSLYETSYNQSYLDTKYKKEYKLLNIRDLYKSFIKPVYETTNIVKEDITFDKHKHIDLSLFDYKYYNKEEHDVFTKMFFDVFSPEIINMTSIDKSVWIKNIKYDVLQDFKKNDIYKKCSYSSSEFKKSDLDETFGMNKSISIDMARIYADVCNINFMIINMDGSIQYKNICLNDRATWLLIENDKGTGYYNIFKLKNSSEDYLRYNNISDIIKKDMKNYIIDSDTNLDILQNIARGLGIDTKTQGKVTKKNKLKEDILIEIKEKIRKLE